ncbi:MAG TPA: hypothetical protein V6C88_17515 [Chroococcidiopsis sp.]
MIAGLFCGQKGGRKSSSLTIGVTVNPMSIAATPPVIIFSTVPTRHVTLSGSFGVGSGVL